MQPDLNSMNIHALRELLAIKTEQLLQEIVRNISDGLLIHDLQRQIEEIKSFIEIHENNPRDMGGLIERLEKVYTNLEYISVHDAEHFSNTGKANLRKAQSEIQRIRLSLYDLMGAPVESNN